MSRISNEKMKRLMFGVFADNGRMQANVKFKGETFTAVEVCKSLDILEKETMLRFDRVSSEKFVKETGLKHWDDVNEIALIESKLINPIEDILK